MKRNSEAEPIPARDRFRVHPDPLRFTNEFLYVARFL